MRRCPCHEKSVGKRTKFALCSNSRLSAACRARLPEDVAAFGRGDMAPGDEEMIGQPVEICEQVRVERLGFIESHRRPCGSSHDRTCKVECRHARRATGKNEAFQRWEARVHDIDVALQPLYLRGDNP